MSNLLIRIASIWGVDVDEPGNTYGEHRDKDVWQQTLQQITGGVPVDNLNDVTIEIENRETGETIDMKLGDYMINKVMATPSGLIASTKMAYLPMEGDWGNSKPAEFVDEAVDNKWQRAKDAAQKGPDIENVSSPELNKPDTTPSPIS